MKQVKYFETYSKGKKTKYWVDDTEQYRKVVKMLKQSNKDLIVTYIEFDDGTNGITNEWCNSVNIIINRTKQATEKALTDFKDLSKEKKYKECVRYGNYIESNDMDTTDGWLSFKIFEIYGIRFLFIIVSGQVTSCYELQ